MITLPIKEAQSSLIRLCHDLAASGESRLIEEDGTALVRLVPEPVAILGLGQRRSIIEDLAEWDRVHGALPEDVPDFPDVWLARAANACNPLPLAGTAWESDWNTPEEDAAWRDL